MRCMLHTIFDQSYPIIIIYTQQTWFYCNDRLKFISVSKGGEY